MSFRIFIGLLTAIMSVLAAGIMPVGAQELFTVKGIPVDATAENAAGARDIAIRDGQARAVAVMMRRLTQTQDHSFLPVSDVYNLPELVDGIRVDNEKTSPTRYLADLTVIFKPEPIRALLRDAGLTVTERQGEVALVLPVTSIEGSFDLFVDDPWTRAWQRAVNGPVGIIPWTMAEGDAEDRVSIEAIDALRVDLERLDPLMQRYGADNVLAALATLTIVGDEVVSAAVEATYIGVPGNRKQSFRAEPDVGEAAEDFLTRVAVGVMQVIENPWKAEYGVSFDESGELIAVVPFNNLTDWTETEKSLRENPRIAAVKMLSFGRRDATLSLSFAGTVDKLQSSLAQDRLTLSNEDNFWYLLPPGVDAPNTPPAGYSAGTLPQLPAAGIDTDPGVTTVPNPIGETALPAAETAPPPLLPLPSGELIVTPPGKAEVPSQPGKTY